MNSRTITRFAAYFLKSINIEGMLESVWSDLSQVEIDNIIESTRRVTETLQVSRIPNGDIHVPPYYVTAIVKMNRSITNILKSKLRLSMTEFRILLDMLDRENGTRGSDLAQRLHLDTGIISITTDRLLEAEYLLQKREKSDKRNRTFHLTEKGRVISREASDLISGAFSKVYGDFEDAELKALIQISIKIDSSF